MSTSSEDNSWSAILIWFVPAIMLLVALADMPYGYYTLLRLVVTFVAVIIALLEKTDRSFSFWFYTACFLALLFNPLIPIHLSKEIWAPIDVVTAVFFVAYSWRFKSKMKKAAR